MDDSAAGQSSSWSESQTSPQAITRNNGTVTIRGFDPPGSPSRQPLGPHRASLGPTGVPIPTTHEARRRRTSFAQRIGSIGDVGGANSFNRFAASWQRAAGFYGITPSERSQSPQVTNDDLVQEEAQDAVSSLEQGQAPTVRTSLLKTALENERRASETLLDEEAPAEGPSAHFLTPDQRKTSAPPGGNLSDPDLTITTSYGSNYGSMYGDHSSQQYTSVNAGRRASQQSQNQSATTDKEREPLLKSRVSSDNGHQDEVVSVQSTLPQTIFNSVNVLVGVGMLSLPLAIHYSGWLIGLVFFLFSALATSYTAKILGRCLDLDMSLVTFADLAYAAFGPRVQFLVSILFSLELTAACVALVILFADSINLLVDRTGLGLNEWKIVCGIILVPLSFLPLRFLSFTSVLGIVCCVAIILAVFVDGFVKSHAIGSLLDPAPTYIFPKDWKTLPLAFGLLMAPWGGHSVFPNIYRDMQHPHKFHRAVNITYFFTYLMEVALAIAGYLMFGEDVKDEITKNIFLTKGYPHWLSIVIVVAITIVPLTKVPLTARPIVSIFEVYFGVEEQAKSSSGVFAAASRWKRRVTRLTIRLLVPVALVIIAILVPSFDRVMSLLGALACFSICIILPCSFHLKLFGKELNLATRILDWSMLISCSFLAVLGTVCSFLPKKMLGADQ